MPYVKPGVKVTQVVEVAGASARTPLLIPGIIGPVYQVEAKRYAAVYEGDAVTLAYPGLKARAVVDQGNGADYPPSVHIRHEGADYDVTAFVGVAFTGTQITLPADVEHTVVAQQMDGAFTGTNQTNFSSRRGGFVKNSVRVNDYLKQGTDLYRIISIDSDTEVTLLTGPASPATGQTYTVVRRVEGDALISYRAARKDPAVIGQYLQFNSVEALEETFGENALSTEQNPLGLATLLAFQAAGTAIGCAGIDPSDTANELANYGKALGLMERSGIYNLAPLTMDTTIQDQVIAHVNNQSTPERRRMRRCYIARRMPTETTAKSGTKAAVFTGNTSRIFVTSEEDDFASVVEPGDQLTVGSNTVTVISVESNSELAIRPALPPSSPQTSVSANAAVGDTSVSVTSGSGFIAGGGTALLWDATNGFRELTYTAYASSAITVAALTTAVPSGATIVPLPANGEGLTYDIKRVYNKQQMTAQAVATGRAINNARVTLVGPDRVAFSLGGETVWLDSFYMAAIRAGQRSGARVGQPFIGPSGGRLPGPTAVNKGSDYFSEDQLNAMAEVGWQFYVQDAINAPIYSRDDLTTRQSNGPAYGQESDVVARDFASYTLQQTLSGLTGTARITPNTIASVTLSINAAIDALVSEIYQPFLSLTLENVTASTSQKGRLTATVRAVQTDAYQGIDLTLVA